MLGECVTENSLGLGFRKVRGLSEAGTASLAEGTACAKAQEGERAWHIPGTGAGQHSRADRARRKVEGDKAGPVSRGQAPQGCESPADHLDFIFHH